MFAPIKLNAPRIAIMNIPGQIVVDSMIGDGVESVISFTDDEHSVLSSLGGSVGGMDSRWEPEDGKMCVGSNNSPKFPQRRSSVVALPTSTTAGAPKLPRRRGTILRSGSEDTDNNSSCDRVRYSRRQSPPRFPSRHRSVESVVKPTGRCKDLVKELSKRTMVKQQSLNMINKQQSIQRNMIRQQSLNNNMVKQQSSARKMEVPNLKSAIAA